MGKLKGKITQMASNMYSEEKIVDKSFNGTHNGEDMRQIFNHIMTSPYIEHEPDKGTKVNMKLEGKVIGWYDTARFMGDIDQKAYNRLKELEASEGEPRPELVSEEGFNRMKNMYNENQQEVLRAMKDNPGNKFEAAANVISPMSEEEFRELPIDDDFDDSYDGDYDGDYDEI